jgi:general secretion pathway protein K
LPLAQFQRLLVSLGIEPRWAAMARDWIDSDETVGQDGAEDSIYTQQNPPYRTGNFPMLSASELLNLPGFGADRYRKIAPYVTALPAADTKINICTALLPVLESLGDNLRGQFGTPEVLANARKQGCFPSQKELQTIAGSKDWPNIQNYQDIKTSYFRLTTLVSLGTSEFTLYSLLANSGTGKYTPVLRSFGTP